MEQQSDVHDIVERLLGTTEPEECAHFLQVVLRELAKGRSLSRKVLATALGWPPQRLTALLDSACSAEFDDDRNIVGYGLTLRETAHAFEIDGQRLYTWCALDTLMFPALLGKSASVYSRCPASGMRIALRVSPHELDFFEPEGVVMSLPPTGTSPDIRRSFCCHVHFLASSQEASEWVSGRPGMEILRIGDAFRLAQDLAAQVTDRARQYRENVA